MASPDILAALNAAFRGEEGAENLLELESAFKGKPKKLADTLLEELAKGLDGGAHLSKLWKPNTGPQTQAFYSEADELFYGGAAGGGKLCDNNTLVATPFGWKKHGDLKVGDQICNPDGTTQRVIAVFPHPNHDVYEVKFSDGASVRAGDDHLWTYWLAGVKIKAQRQYPTLTDEGLVWEDHPSGNTIDGKVCTTLQLKELLDKADAAEASGKRGYYPLIPLTKPVTYTRPSRTRQGNVIRIDPYLLGLLLGDGCITGTSSITITTIDSFIVERVKSIYGDDHTFYDNIKTIRLRKTADLVRELESYGLLGTRSGTKFIPENYLYASVEQRFALMAGMIDTDGYVDDRGHVSYTTVSEQLAKDFQQLARSLGARATITTKEAGYRKEDGTFIECQLAYTVYLQGDLSNFMSLPRKKERYKPFNGGDTPGRRVVSIEYAGKADCSCIAVDHWNQLYVVQDFIVTHNTDLIIGLAVSDLSGHRKSIIFRRDYKQLKDIIERMAVLLADTQAKFNGNTMLIKGIPGGKTVEFGSINTYDDVNKYKGRPHDLKAFDELSDFSHAMYTFLIGWARTTEIGVPVRVIGAGNPPTSSDGEWVIRHWAPWIDPQHDNPALPGELRYYATIDGEDKELENGDPFEWKGEIIKPKSRTFVPARLDDNPALAKTDYRTVLQNMPEPYRSQLLYGDFGLTVKDNPWQVCPPTWVKWGKERWQIAEANGDLKKAESAEVTYGLDVAEAGKDMTVLVKITGQYVQWIRYLKEPDLMKQAEWVVAQMTGSKNSRIGVDALGVGSGLSSRLKQLGFDVIGVKVSTRSVRRSRGSNLSFLNLRSDLWWSIREKLDPDSGLSLLGIYPDPKLIEELSAPRYSLTSKDTIQVEGRDEIKERIGRSPDAASALMLALYVTKERHVPPRLV